MEDTTAPAIDQTSPELIEALATTLGPIFGHERLMAEALHTGGGCMVAAVDLSQDGRFMGRQIWLTREGPNEWLLGLYDYALDPEDEGLCVTIRGFRNNDSVGPLYRHGPDDPTIYTSNSPLWVAAQVGGILERLGVDKLQGA